MGVMYEAIEDSVGEGRIADDLVPGIDRQLAGDQRRAGAITVLDDLHEVAPLVGREPVWAPVIEDQQIGLGKRAEQTREAAVSVGQFEIGKEARHTCIMHRIAVTAGSLRQRAAEPRLADTARSGDQQIAMLGNPAAGGQLLEQRLVEPSGGTIVNFLHCSPALRLRRLRRLCGPVTCRLLFRCAFVRRSGLNHIFFL